MCFVAAAKCCERGGMSYVGHALQKNLSAGFALFSDRLITSLADAVV